MMNLLRSLCLALLAMTMPPDAAHAQAQKKADAATMAWRYEIMPVSVGPQGTAVVRVSAYSRKLDVALTQIRKNAVHGILFKGYGGASGIPGRTPLVRDPAFTVNQPGFMAEFFKGGGDYARFIGQVLEDEMIRTDLGKGVLKIEVVVTVMVDQLREYMEALGYLKTPHAGY